MASPACTELEVQVMNWLGKILDLPKQFLNESEGPGGGVLQVGVFCLEFKFDSLNINVIHSRIQDINNDDRSYLKIKIN